MTNFNLHVSLLRGKFFFLQIIDSSNKNHGKYLAIKVTEDRIHISDFDDVNNNRQFDKTFILGFFDDKE